MQKCLRILLHVQKYSEAFLHAKEMNKKGFYKTSICTQKCLRILLHTKNRNKSYHTSELVVRKGFSDGSPCPSEVLFFPGLERSAIGFHLGTIPGKIHLDNYTTRKEWTRYLKYAGQTDDSL